MSSGLRFALVFLLNLVLVFIIGVLGVAVMRALGWPWGFGIVVEVVLGIPLCLYTNDKLL